VALCHTEVHLAARPCANQAILYQRLEVTPRPESIERRKDYFGNEIASFSIEQPHRELVIVSRCLAELRPAPPPNLNLSPDWGEVAHQVRLSLTPDIFEARQFLFESPLIRLGSAFANYARPSFPEGRHFLDGVNDLSSRIFHEFKYDPRATTVSTAVDEVLHSKRGVCQDFAHLMVACLRSIGLPARYVSGYVRTDGTFAGSEASHAWVSVWCPVFGWQDFDPTNDVMPHGDHVTVAWGRDYSDVSPVKGVALGGGEQVIKLSVEVAVPEKDDAR
jgi:transglutaminase-like putative cysteine protease